MAPYVDIKDPNLPGTYDIEAIVMQTLGPGAIAWRIWDWALILALTISMIEISKPYGRFPAIFAATLFALIHARDGIIQLGQRDLLLAVLFLISAALLLRWFRNGARYKGQDVVEALALVFLIAFAALVKPIALLFFVGLICWIAVMRACRKDLHYSFLRWAAVGALVPSLLAAAFLHRWHAGAAF